MIYNKDIEEISLIKKFEHLDEEVEDLVFDLINIDKVNNNLNFDKEFKLLCKKYYVCPSKNQIRKIYEMKYNDFPITNKLKRWFIKKGSRSESGVLVVTIVTKPGEDIKFSCPEKCAYCPTETNLAGKPTQPKSYISTEPAMMRALQSDFSIKGQIDDRLRSYTNTGNMNNNKDKKKIEVILSGGTWDVMPKNYRDQVMNELYWGFNTFGDKNPREMKSIAEEIKINETSLYGVIGLSIETRPDYVTKSSIKQYLDYGVTRVQIGVQHLDDDVLRTIKRGCLTINTIKAIRLLKMVGLKIVVHIMPDLPSSTKEKDILVFKRLIEDPDLQFDDIKIYPTAVIKSASDDLIVTSDINKWYEDGTYKPYAEENLNDLFDVCIYYKTRVKPWVRIERLIRDIPKKSITVGYNKVSNLRQLVIDRMTKNGDKCNCIRCREVKSNNNKFDNIKLVVRKYIASYGLEFHITYETEKYYWTFSYILFLFWYYWNKLFNNKVYYSGNDKLYEHCFGFLRLRIDPTPGGDFVPEINNCGIIREVHVYGISSEVGTNNDLSSQHKGIGKKLVSTAEQIIKKYGFNKVAIIAGIGAREYYKNKCGYNLNGRYMIKNL
jgi:ELP3 family radical SAM enzyme/protein acetyltransferase